MPIYDYICTSCDHRADILHGINDPGPNFCPSCGAEGTMRKQFAAPAIHFKGSGWAKKDRGGSSTGTKASRASSGESAKDAGSSGSEGAASTSSASSDAKPTPSTD
ncbi:MAG: FmdB family zinc ribbon protein [Rhodospirillaceae bacterium]